MSRKMGDLVAFVRDYRSVQDAIARHCAKPFVADPLLNAYDFRPYYGDAFCPSRAVVFKALLFLGYRKAPGDDWGLFERSKVNIIGVSLDHVLETRFSEYQIKHFINVFRHYSELKEGRKLRWRLLKI